jgi:hypothetical protein
VLCASGISARKRRPNGQQGGQIDLVAERVRHFPAQAVTTRPGVHIRLMRRQATREIAELASVVEGGAFAVDPLPMPSHFWHFVSFGRRTAGSGDKPSRTICLSRCAISGPVSSSLPSPRGTRTRTF